ncbi:alanine racemase [Kineosporia rhizophila]|uniref:alanine racemase n=1 Tax=Kineosporia rhizophila TaxID=84633 RepID=UPI001E512014|nr:alanine racemase [Kineosporia rhizophila]MCE0536910.1 alanine racemase [Kineosporia rhizophila]
MTLVDHARSLPLGGAETGKPELSVDLTAVAANTRHFRRLIDGELMAVVKADGFGHGATQVARTALVNGATRLGVTSLAEALALRAAGIRAPVLSWLNPVATDWRQAVAAEVEVAVPSLQHLTALPAGTAVHLHLDCGLARDGAEPAVWPAPCAAAAQAQHLRVVGVMGHLSSADVPADPVNAVQRERFDWGVQVARAAGLQPQHLHLAATAGTLNDPLSHHTMSRIGAGLFGIDPLNRLRPALTLTAPLVSVRQVGAGTGVGYGHGWVAPEATVLGLIALGYADGLPRAASGQAQVLVGGRRRALVGRISMDMAVIDLGPGSSARPGDLVTVFGPGEQGEPTVAEWASWAGTIEHEVVTGLGTRPVRRVRSAGPGRQR